MASLKEVKEMDPETVKEAIQEVMNENDGITIIEQSRNGLGFMIIESEQVPSPEWGMPVMMDHEHDKPRPKISVAISIDGKHGHEAILKGFSFEIYKAAKFNHVRFMNGRMMEPEEESDEGQYMVFVLLDNNGGVVGMFHFDKTFFMDDE